MALTRQDKEFQSFVEVNGTTARRVYTVNPVQLLFSGGINPRGTYDNLATYSTGDLVTYLGSSYVAIQETTGNLPTDQTYWQISAEKGDAGEKGDQGDSWQETFETVSKNLKSWDATINYLGENIASIAYSNGVNTITKTFNYSAGSLVSIVLSGDTPDGISLTKNFSYLGGSLVGVSYS